MMKYIVVLALALFSLSSSAESLYVHDTGATKPRARLFVKRTQKVLLPAVPGEMDDNNSGGSDDIDVYIGYRRPEIVNTPGEDLDLSDYVKTRLLIARTRALKRYLEIQSQTV